jgi:hypothetical protein
MSSDAPNGPGNRPGAGPEGSPSRFLCNGPRKLSLIAGLAAVLDIIVGAGLGAMRASNAPTSRETMIVRWVALGLLAIGVVAYVIGGRLRNAGGTLRKFPEAEQNG